MKKTKKLDARLALFNYTVEKYKSVDEAKCECGKVREIYDKAKEMGLVKVYDEMESEHNSVTATIKETSVVLFDFACRNEEQKPGGVIPMAFALNY